MPYTIIRNSITNVRADAIVSSVNPDPVVGRGLDAAVYKAAGYDELLEARRKIGPIDRGDAAVTPAFRLPAKYIIHTVGPVWMDGTRGEFDVLHSCYRKSLALAKDLGCKSIALPLIATGVYGFPKDKALEIALEEIRSFLNDNEVQVTLVVYSRDAFVVSERIIGGVRQFIEDSETEKNSNDYTVNYNSMPRENIVRQPLRKSRNLPGGRGPEGIFKAGKMRCDTADAGRVCLPESETVLSTTEHIDGEDDTEKAIKDILSNTSETFQVMLLRLIDESGLGDVKVYKKANIDRKVFSKIRSRKDYKPKKETAIAFAIALELDINTTRDLLARAGLALSPSSKFDLIISYFLTRRIYDIDEINQVLFSYKLNCLGASE